MTEPVSVELKGISIEECVRRLLKNRNYALTFDKSGNDNFILVSIRVTEKGTVARHIYESKHRPQLPSGDSAKVEPKSPFPRDDHFKRYSKELFAQMLGESNDLVGKAFADTVEGGPYPGGIRINNLSEKSAFSKIGLKEGDIVHNVNGRPVRTAEEFFQTLQIILKEEPMIVIERGGDRGEINPIFIELH